MTTTLDIELKKHASPRQSEYIDAVNGFGSYSEAARHFNVASSTIRESIYKLRKKTEDNKYIINEKPLSILFLPDSQVKPDEDLAFLHCQGKYIVDKLPDVIVDIGDFADMSSLSSYDKGKRSYEGRRYKSDIEAAITGMKIRMKPVRDYNYRQLALGKPIYKPKMYLTLGNHEHRIDRAVDLDPMLYGTISIDDLRYKDFGWEVIPFLEVKLINGVAFSHYFTTGTMGRPCSSATAMLNKKHMSCVAGHQQGLQLATGVKADGNMITCAIAGSGYEHAEDYLGPQGNAHWRGILMFHNVINGQLDPVMVPNSYLRERYNPEGKKYFTCPED